VNLSISVNLQDNSTQYGNDKINLEQPRSTGRPFSWNTLTIENCSVIVKRGETRKFNISYLLDSYSGIREITYATPFTPLNVTINPSRFNAKHFLEFPSVVTITTDPSLIPGKYPVSFTINGLNDSLLTRCNDNSEWMVPVDVTVV